MLLLLAHMRPVQAEHLPGGTMSYRCLGGNYYEITLALPRNCTGTQMLAHSLRFTNDCGVNFNVQGIQHQEVVDGSMICPAEAGNTTCDDGPLIGLRTYIFKHTIYLSPCSGWTIAWSVCCRPESLNLIGLPGVYVEARLNNTGGICNDSPVFVDHDLPFVCPGQTMHYDPFVVETDGDSLVYALVDARYAAPSPTPVLYQPGWSGALPYENMSIDPVTGRISFTAGEVGQVVAAVQVSEYRNGSWIGSAMRDFPIMITPCENSIPSIGDGTITVLSGDVTITGPMSFEICAQNAGSIQATYSDPNVEQVLNLWSTVELVLPGTSVSVSGTNPVELTISWEAIDAPAGVRHFGVKVQDDHCPIRGLQTYSYKALVRLLPAAIPPGSATLCAMHGSFQLADSLDGALPAGGAWSGPEGGAHSGLFDPATDQAGIYTYTLNAGTSCQWSVTVAVIVLPESDPACIGLGVHVPSVAEIRAWPNPATDRLYVEGLPLSNGLPVVLELLDLHGCTIWSGASTTDRGMHVLDLPAHLANGTYLLRMAGAEQAIMPLRFVLAR